MIRSIGLHLPRLKSILTKDRPVFENKQNLYLHFVLHISLLVLWEWKFSVWKQKFKVRTENKDALEGQHKGLQFGCISYQRESLNWTRGLPPRDHISLCPLQPCSLDESIQVIVLYCAISTLPASWHPQWPTSWVWACLSWRCCLWQLESLEDLTG